MEYYKGNAIYDYFNKTSDNRFKFACANQWQIVYGNLNCQPKLLLAISGLNSTEIETPRSLDKEKIIFEPLKEIHRLTGIPLILLRFDINKEEINEVFIVDYANNQRSLQRIKINDLSSFLEKFDLPIIKNTSTTKYLNDKTSSAFHNWQRANLGAKLQVSNLDLIKFSPSNKISDIYELKRSYYDLNRWEPFPADFNNFKLLWNLCKSSNINLHILYNQKTRNPVDDKIDVLKIYNIPINSQAFGINKGNIIKLQDFIKI